MKANKVLKRLAKIEALILKVTERSSASAPHIRELLGDVKAAVIRAKEAVSLQASSGTAKNPPMKRSKPPSKCHTRTLKTETQALGGLAGQQIVAALKKR